MHPNNHTPKTHTSDISTCVVVMVGTWYFSKTLNKSPPNPKSQERLQQQTGSTQNIVIWELQHSQIFFDSEIVILDDIPLKQSCDNFSETS